MSDGIGRGSTLEVKSGGAGCTSGIRLRGVRREGHSDLFTGMNIDSTPVTSFIRITRIEFLFVTVVVVDVEMEILGKG